MAAESFSVKKIPSGVTAPAGFEAAGIHAGLKEGDDVKDMALIYTREPAVCAGTFTKNVVKAAPVLWDQAVVQAETDVRAVVINSGGANACTGAKGYKNCEEEPRLAAELFGCTPEEIFVCSTGVIGQQLDMPVIKKGIRLLAEKKARREDFASDAAQAILTTDTHKKECAVTCLVGGKTITVGGMAKGSGMIHPNMGTMLAFVTTDAAVDRTLLRRLVREEVEETFNMISVDGDTSTNDTCLVLANGMAENVLLEEDSEDLPVFRGALHEVLLFLAKSIAGDGEGCTRLFEVCCQGAPTKACAKTISKSVVCSNLTKAAVFGRDANWGRILCAMGYSGADFDPDKVDIILSSDKGSLAIVKDGVAADYSEETATEILSGQPVRALLHLHAGEEEATAWGCDLTYDYITINAEYRS